MTALAPTVEAFFTQRLAVQRDASPHTVAAFRDTLRLLLVSPTIAPANRPPGSTSATSTPRWSRRSSPIWKPSGTTACPPATPGSPPSTRYSATPPCGHHEHAESIQRVLAIPAKRHQQKLVCFLTREEIDALLSAPDNGTWFGRRDHTLLTLAVQTGLRVSELTRLVRP